MDELCAWHMRVRHDMNHGAVQQQTGVHGSWGLRVRTCSRNVVPEKFTVKVREAPVHSSRMAAP